MLKTLDLDVDKNSKIGFCTSEFSTDFFFIASVLLFGEIAKKIYLSEDNYLFHATGNTLGIAKDTIVMLDNKHQDNDQQIKI